jgi:hypothetical protein
MRGRGPVVILSVLAGLFFLRVLGQALVAFMGVTFLPAMPEWYSGLLPYPLLLPVQLVILAIQGKVSLDLARGRGFFVVRRPGPGRGLQVFAAVYFVAMVLRYALTMAWYPERRWLGTGTIPVVFHWVLAAYLFALGRFLARAPVAERSPA